MPHKISFSSRGDLARLVGMHTVAFLGLVGEINSDVGLSRKGRVVGGICFSKAMFWDSKYRVSAAMGKLSCGWVLYRAPSFTRLSVTVVENLRFFEAFRITFLIVSGGCFFAFRRDYTFSAIC